MLASLAYNAVKRSSQRTSPATNPRRSSCTRWPPEPPKDYSLFGMENVVATPHLGAATAEAQENVALQVAEQISDYLLTGAVTNAINMPSVSAEESPRLRPYMALAEQLGSFAGQLVETRMKSVTVEYEGHAAELNTRPLTACVLLGLLRPLLDSVNMVNAPVIARERGIDVAEVKHERDCEYQTLVRVNVTTERRTRTVAGTLVGGDKLRIVDINGLSIEAEMAPRMLYTVNEDKPGIIGRLGAVLGDAGVNIATFNLGRTAEGGEAIAIIGVDQNLSDAVLETVRALPNVIEAKSLSF